MKKSNVKILVSQTAEFNRAKGQSVMESLMQKYPNFDAVFGANDEMIIGAVEAMSAAEVNPSSKVTIGFDATPDAFQYMKEGKLGATIDQFPGKQAGQALKYLVAYIKTKTKPPKAVDVHQSRAGHQGSVAAGFTAFRGSMPPRDCRRRRPFIFRAVPGTGHGSTVLRMSGICKSFPGVRALDRVSLDLNASRGPRARWREWRRQVDAHEDTVGGLPGGRRRDMAARTAGSTATGPRAMIDAGVSVIYQELNLVPYLSVAENIFLGREPRKAGGFIDWKKMRTEVASLLEPFGLSLDPRAKIHSIGPAYQQVVEIAKALSLSSDILVMDEPTAALTGHEVDRLFEVIRNLRKKGVSVIYISHRLQEIKQVADRVTVLRDGQHIVTARRRGASPSTRSSATWLAASWPSSTPRCTCRRGTRSCGWKVSRGARSARTCPSPCSEGRSSGFAGLVGAGRTEIMELIYGARRKDSGQDTSSTARK